jgi:hypothetical protein
MRELVELWRGLDS